MKEIRNMPEPVPGDTYEPDTIQVNRGRERGLGVGQKDIDYQRDPMGVVPAERWVNTEPGPRVRPPDPLPPELDPPPRGLHVEEPAMPQKPTRTEKAPARKAATEPRSSVRPEAQSYVAHDPRDASLAPPAAGEVGEAVDDIREDFLEDEAPVDDTFGEVQMGGDRRLVAGKDAVLSTQGRKTMHANKQRLHSSPVRGRR